GNGGRRAHKQGPADEARNRFVALRWLLPASRRRSYLWYGLRHAAIGTHFHEVGQVSPAIGAGFQLRSSRVNFKRQDDFAFRAETVMEFWLFVYGWIVKASRAGENSRTMANKDVAIVILAGGKGKRLKSALAKVLHPAGGKTLIKQDLISFAPLKPKKLITVSRQQS